MHSCCDGHPRITWDDDLPACPLCAALDLAVAAEEFAAAILDLVADAPPRGTEVPMA